MAVVATAHKLVRIIYAMIRDQTEYTDVAEERWEQKRRALAVRALQRRAKSLGVELVEKAA